MDITITIGIVWSREEFIHDTLNSIYNQDYKGDIKVVIFDNREKKYSIGYCQNRIAETCKTLAVAYIGDDDFIDRDYISTLIRGYTKFIHDTGGTIPAGMSCNVKMFNNGENKYKKCEVNAEGSFYLEHILANPFNEDIKNMVDVEMFARNVATLGYGSCTIKNYYGYYYRQHSGNVSGSEFNVDKWEEHKDKFKSNWLDIDWSITKCDTVPDNIKIEYIKGE